MARRVRSSVLEGRSMRLKLAIRKKPYAFVTIAPGIAIGYRRNKGPGTWVLRASNGRGGYWTDVIGLADDHEDADGEQVLSFWQAQDRARVLVRGKAGEDHRPITTAEAIYNYERDLAARGGLVANARYVRSLLPPALLAKPVALLGIKELRAWRDGLRSGRQPSSVTRICKSTKAAFNLVAAHDPRITNQKAWTLGLAALPDSHVARHVGLSEQDVRTLVSAAYVEDVALGLFVETAAVTGARPSQLSRLEVGDLQDDRGDPRLMMSSSRKGKGKKRIERRPVPIPVSLAVKLRAATEGRHPHDPLLVRGNGARWQHSNHVRPFRAVAAAAGLDVTLYALRHSSIIRMLLSGVPTRVTAAQHDSSVSMLEKHYSAFVLDHSDAVVRRAMLDLAAPTADTDVMHAPATVVALPRRRS
jgi:integrase